MDKSWNISSSLGCPVNCFGYSFNRRPLPHDGTLEWQAKTWPFHLNKDSENVHGGAIAQRLKIYYSKLTEQTGQKRRAQTLIWWTCQLEIVGPDGQVEYTPMLQREPALTGERNRC